MDNTNYDKPTDSLTQFRTVELLASEVAGQVLRSLTASPEPATSAEAAYIGLENALNDLEDVIFKETLDRDAAKAAALKVAAQALRLTVDLEMYDKPAPTGQDELRAFVEAHFGDDDDHDGLDAGHGDEAEANS